MDGFNPRPPISQRATTRATGAACCAGSFNPRPPISQRATRRLAGLVTAYTRFNPRPPISQRATGDRQRVVQDGPVSIHARQFHSGRQATADRACARRRRFNPRPPISQRATASEPVSISPVAVFQSTPANFTAGDQPLHWPARTPPVSIHARQFHSGRHRARVIDRWEALVSIHARQFHSGRPSARRCRWRSLPGFNPRPPISQRATASPRHRSAAHTRFNPRPPISQRATCNKA